MSRKALLNRCRYSWRIRVDRARRRFWPRLPFEKTKASPPLTESQFEIIVGIVTTLIFLLFPLTWQLKVVCVMVLCALVALLAFRSHFMLGYGVRVKLPLALVIISGILWKAWKPIKDQYVGTPIVADRPVGLLVWGFSVGQQASGMPATVGIRVKNNTVKTIKLKTAYAVAVRKAALLLPEERAVFAVQAVQDEVFSRAEEYFANSRRENSLLTQEIPPGQLTMYIYGNPLNQERFAELSHGSMSIYFAGIMEYEVEGASKRITYCGYTSAQLKTIPLCGQHNDAEADALPSR